jgi:hypothetical protein
MPRASYYPKSGSIPPRMEVQQVDVESMKNKTYYFYIGLFCIYGSAAGRRRVDEK